PPPPTCSLSSLLDALPILKYTQADMDLNTKRLAYVGKLISRHGVSVIIAAVAPMQEYRDRARDWIENFVEVFVDCPTDVCKQREIGRAHVCTPVTSGSRMP